MTILRKPYFFPQRCTVRVAAVTAITLFSLLCSDYAAAAVYQCKGKGGVTVLTDRPEGLQGCVQIQTLAPSPPRPTSPAPEIPTPSLDLDQQPTVIFPNPTAPPFPPPETFRDPVPPNTDTEKPPAPTASDAQPCSSGINPLNPLTGGNCPPTAAEPPVEPKNP